MKPSYEISRRQRRAKAINQEIIVKNNLIAGNHKYYTRL